MELTKNQEIYESIVQEAWANEDFKAALMENPIKAIEKLTDHVFNLPEGKKLVVRDQTNESTIYINIPVKKEIDNVELNEDQLEAVVGGGPFEDSSTGPFNPIPEFEF